MKKISIIIPHYNSPIKLERLLNSIGNADNIETIVVDDNSDVEKNLNKLKNNKKYKHVKFFENKSDEKGAGVCRNIGINSANCEWIIFADADDYFLEEWYMIVEKYLKTNFDVIYFAPTSYDEKNKKICDRHIQYKKIASNFFNNHNLKNELILRYGFFVPWSKMIRKTLIIQYNLKFDHTIVSNDVMFSTKIGHFATEISATEKTIYCVTKSEKTLTTTLNEEKFDVRVVVMLRYFTFLKENISKSDFKLLGFSGYPYIIKAYKDGYGIKKSFEIYQKLRKNNIPIVQLKWHFLNPVFWIKLIFKK